MDSETISPETAGAGMPESAALVRALIVSQFPLMDITAGGTELTLHLGLKHTDCLARATCGVGDDGGCGSDGEDEACCTGAGESKSCC